MDLPCFANLLPQLLDDYPFTRAPVEFSRGVNRNDRPFIDGKEYFPLCVRSTCNALLTPTRVVLSRNDFPRERNAS